MPLERLEGPDLFTLMSGARRLLGEDAVVMGVRRVTASGARGYELIAADPGTAAAANTRPAPRPSGATFSMRPVTPGRRGSPLVVALVGPTGAGKTTTLAKLANHPRVFGGWPAGLLCLDTWRVGAIEQLRVYAEISGLPLAVAFEPGEVAGAMRRLAGCEVVLVDTAGRGPKQAHEVAAVLAPLAEHGPLEVHLTLPSGLRLEQARRFVRQHRPLGVTHLLATKLDECPDDTTVFAIAGETGLPMRWLTDGQEVPHDLRSASSHRRGGTERGVAVEARA